MAAGSSKPFVDKAMERISRSPMVLDIGGGDRFGKWLKAYEPLFKNCQYKSFDYDASTGADVVGDIHAMPLPDDSVDAIICSSVLEHVRDPIRAMEELTRILKPSGQIFLYVPSIYPYHARKGHYPDLWRFFSTTPCSNFSRGIRMWRSPSVADISSRFRSLCRCNTRSAGCSIRSPGRLMYSSAPTAAPLRPVITCMRSSRE